MSESAKEWLKREKCNDPTPTEAFEAGRRAGLKEAAEFCAREARNYSAVMQLPDHAHGAIICSRGLLALHEKAQQATQDTPGKLAPSDSPGTGSGEGSLREPAPVTKQSEPESDHE